MGEALQEGAKVISSDLGMKCMRAKYFSEQEDNQRILILKNELKRTQQQVATLCNVVNKLMEHDHLNGGLITRLKNTNEEPYGSLYFREEEFK